MELFFLHAHRASHVRTKVLGESIRIMAASNRLAMSETGSAADASHNSSDKKPPPSAGSRGALPECSQGVLWTLSVPKTSFWVNSLVCIDDSRIPGVYENGGIHVCKLVVSWDYTGQWTPRCDEFLEMGAMLCMAKYKSAVPLLCVLFLCQGAAN